MGCGQSKINLYPRRNKNGGKANSAKKSGAVDKEADEEAGSAGGGVAGGGAGGAAAGDEDDRTKHLLPLVAHSTPLEISASQQDFFKMLDEKIDKGKDYDSSSENEQRLEQERRRTLIQQWRSTSLSTQSSRSQPSPPTPARRRPPADPAAPASPHDTRSPAPARRCCRMNGDRDWQHAPDSPKRAPAHWRTNPKVAPYGPAKKKGLDSNDNRAEPDAAYSHGKQPQPAQPYIAQIVTYPMSQQVAPQSPPYIAPPEQYQDPQGEPRAPVYYIGAPEQQLAQQRHQTAIHLQQYVAMKQAQQHMFGFYQRTPHAVFPDDRDVGAESVAGFAHPALRPHSAPSPTPSAASGYASDALWGRGAVWTAPEVQYYPPQLVFRPGSAGSAGTLPRSREGGACQSLSVVRAKPVGQVVCGAELSVVRVRPEGAPDPPQPPDGTARRRAVYGRTLKNSKSLDST